MALITANTALEVTTIDFSSEEDYLLDPANTVTLLNNVDFTSDQGRTYEDVLRIEFPDDVTWRDNWCGTGIVFDPVTRAITAGTLTAFIGTDSGAGFAQDFAVEDFSFSAVAFYNAMASATPADDLAMVRSMLSGSDTFNLSPQNDNVWGWTGNDTMRGNGGNDILYGDAGNDWLDGGTGNDLLYGGTGNDTYVVNSASDVVTEAASAGTDAVRSSVTRTLGSNQENLVLTGSVAINGTGNSANNVITGNSAKNTLNGGSGNDTINGGAGADTMIGGTGNDTLVTDNVGDVLTELAGGGTDTVQSSRTYTLGGTLENLTLTGSAAINGTGNTLANVLTGNAAANTLNGSSGADQMAGGAGNDIYYVDNAYDIVTEAAGAGTDSVRSSVTRNLGVGQENLLLTGGAAINGRGNDLVNVLTGNGAANALYGSGGNDQLAGGAGNDSLNGGLGNDTLSGGTGLDRFSFTSRLNATTNVDRITGFVSADDRINLDDVFAGIGPDGALAAAAFRAGAAAADATDRIIYNITTGALSFDADGNGAGAAILFATVAPGTSVVLGDFFVV